MLCSVAQLCTTLWDPMNCSPPGSSVHGILQERIVEWVAMPSSRGPSQSKDQTSISCFSWVADRLFTAEPSLGTKLCPTLCDPMGCSPPGSSVHGISQARILGWVAISFSRGSSWPKDGTLVPYLAGRLFTAEPPAKPIVNTHTYTHTHIYRYTKTCIKNM